VIPKASFLFDITRIILEPEGRTFSWAFIRAWRFVPEPEMRTVMRVSFDILDELDCAFGKFEILIVF